MYVLSNVHTLYDGTGPDTGSVQHGVDIWVQGGRIHKIAPHDNRATSGERLDVVDCTDHTVVPGLVDCHSHIVSLGIDDAGTRLMNQSQSWLLFVEKILHATLVDGGVTSIRDIGGATHFIKRMVDSGILIGPRLKIAICMLSTTGGHADFQGPDRCHAQISLLWPEMPGRPSSVVDGPWECRKRVREIVASGADLIKICASPGVASPSDKLEQREFTREELTAICDEAAARGLPVAAHAHSVSGIELAIQCGVKDIQHISFMDERLAEMAHERGCTVTPTSWVIQELTRQKDLVPLVAEKVKSVADVHARAVHFAAKGGLKVLAGTDPVLPGMHGKNYLEVDALIKDGLSPLAAWYGATGLAASEIGFADTGKLIAGHRADFLVCRGHKVLDDPKLLGQGLLVEVCKDGEGYRGGLPKIPQRTYATNIGELLSTVKPSYF